MATWGWAGFSAKLIFNTQRVGQPALGGLLPPPLPRRLQRGFGLELFLQALVLLAGAFGEGRVGEEAVVDVHGLEHGRVLGAGVGQEVD